MAAATAVSEAVVLLFRTLEDRKVVTITRSHWERLQGVEP
jgi:hypothetical protein